MQRRTAIRNLLVISGGVSFLPGCLNEPPASSGGWKHLAIGTQEEALLEAVAETIIPATDTPGASELGVHLFVLKMVDDCHTRKDQEEFLKGLRQLDAIAGKQQGRSFIALKSTDREALLQSLTTDEQAPPESRAFLKIMKQRTIQGYLNSRYVMSDLLIYELVPGRYDGYFPVNQA